MKQSPRSRKVKAVLASGAVLGVGAAVTLAAWTDQEAATATFGSGVFVLESTVDGTDWDDHGGDPVELAFDGADLTPDTSTASFFGLQLTDDTDYDASVEMTTDGTAASGYSYSLYEVADADACTTDVTGEALVEDSALDAGTTSFGLTTEEPALLCFVVTAGDIEQGSTAGATWTFEATSN